MSACCKSDEQGECLTGHPSVQSATSFENTDGGGYFLPNEVDLHEVIVLPKAEWERIQDNLGSTTREAARILAEKKEREEMHLRSKAAVKDWPNTIMGLAQRKLKAKQLREEREEEERKLLDLEEEQFQAAKRKEAIDHAKTYLYYQNERVKGLHSALLLAEVLKERDAQVELKKLKSGVNKKKDEEQEHECQEAILREQEKAHQRYMNQQALRRDQLEQIKEHKHQADLAKLENKREGEQIQRLNQLYQLEIQRRMEKEQEEKVERQRLYHEHVTDQKTIKAVEEQKQREEDERIKAHFKAKETIAKLIKEKEAEMRRLTQEHQDKIVSQLAVQMNEALKREDDRLARDIAKKEAEQEKKCKEKEAKEKAAIESIAEHRAVVAEKEAKKQQEKQADLDYNAQMEAIELCKEREFQSYAKQVIESESKTTHHLYPLLKASKDECSSHLLEGSLPGRAREELLEEGGGGGPTSCLIQLPGPPRAFLREKSAQGPAFKAR
ncbi:PREDICTED: coiled-coil domain-containing protein 173 [Nipponia nippon]|uniref:coiled-coil domain-containing protein 173 n=1 Tax=Nipponia nippon TaxID=128390 RepID=UPI0005113B47|nr:PREDICTED: coiled-coil domain-containing protein 173 [Nipponia nippon]